MATFNPNPGNCAACGKAIRQSLDGLCQRCWIRAAAVQVGRPDFVPEPPRQRQPALIADPGDDL